MLTSHTLNEHCHNINVNEALVLENGFGLYSLGGEAHNLFSPINVLHARLLAPYVLCTASKLFF